MVWVFFVLLVMVHATLALVHLVNFLGMTVSLVGLHLGGEPLMLALGRAEIEMPATAACTDGAGAAETGVTSAVIPATLSMPTAEARPIHFLSRNKCPPSSLRPPCPRASQHGPRTTPHLLGMSHAVKSDRRFASKVCLAGAVARSGVQATA